MTEVTETRAEDGDDSGDRKVMGVVAIFSESANVAWPSGSEIRGTCRIGRDPHTEVPIDDSQVSREHSSIAAAPGGAHVADLGSRNGTYVNGTRVDSEGIIAPFGSVVRCGGTLLRIVDNITPFFASTKLPVKWMVGGPSTAAIWHQAKQIGPLPHSALILGETGTGKEVVARALHETSGRQGELVSVNCGAIPADLIESELFGHARGAFSGSIRHRMGLFRTANHGTLLLDELGELPLPAQAKILRAMEDEKIRAVGDDRATPVDVRVIGATNVDLDRHIAEGRFRADLYHRVAVWRIQLPPLRDRVEDIPLLTMYFLEGTPTAMTVEAMEQLVLCPWPGNVRELRNAVTRACVQARSADQSRIGVRHLAANQAPAPQAPKNARWDLKTADLRARVETALALREGNVSQVAKDLKCTRPWLYLTIKGLNIDPSSFRKPK